MSGKPVLTQAKSVHKFTSSQAEKVTINGVIRSMWNLCKDKRFMHMAPQFCWTGISIAFYSGLLVVMMAEAIGGTDQ